MPISMTEGAWKVANPQKATSAQTLGRTYCGWASNPAPVDGKHPMIYRVFNHPKLVVTKWDKPYKYL